MHIPGHALLRGGKQCLDIPAHGIQQLSLVHQIAIRLCDELLDALLAPGQHQLFELAVRREQHLGRGCLEGDSSLGADDRVAEVYATADAEGCRKRFERLDDPHRCVGLAIERHRAAFTETERVALGWASVRERAAREDPGVVGDGAGGGEGLLATDGHAPQAAVDRVFRAGRGHRQRALAQVGELVLAAECLIAHRCEHLESGREGA